MINAGRVPAYSESGAAQEVSPPSPTICGMCETSFSNPQAFIEHARKCKGGDTRELKAALKELDFSVLTQAADYLNQLGGGPMEDRLRLLSSEFERLLGEPTNTVK